MKKKILKNPDLSALKNSASQHRDTVLKTLFLIPCRQNKTAVYFHT